MAEPPEETRVLKDGLLRSLAPGFQSEADRQAVSISLQAFRSHLNGQTAWAGTKLPLLSSYKGRYQFTPSREVFAFVRRIETEQGSRTETPMAHLESVVAESVGATLLGVWGGDHGIGGLLTLDAAKLGSLAASQGLTRRQFMARFRRWALSWQVSDQVLRAAIRSR